jgi:hypothetical protein
MFLEKEKPGTTESGFEEEYLKEATTTANTVRC